MTSPRPLTDAEIVALYLARDESAVEHTARNYGAYCTSVAMNILNDSSDAEECVNDTYLRTWNSIPPHRPTVLRLFLGKITRNLAIDKYRANKSRNRELEIALEEVSEFLPAKEEDDGELPVLLGEFLATLPAEERDLFILRYYHGHSVARLSKAFKVKPNSLSARLYRTREKLRVYLTEREYSL
ncbi:MAG: RNA polymerase sigma factor [Clostridia bacterium]|nr:RNA polymerase sigma factor [Clostridia bacterium]MBR6782795.1 RNA polymerase sigma factor [Clostridia bacterium]